MASNHPIAESRGKEEKGGEGSSTRRKAQKQAAPFIYKVPWWIRGDEEDAYKPRVIGIGPYHHDDENLQAIDKHKKNYQRDLLRNIRGRSSDAIPSVLQLIEEEVKTCYAEEIIHADLQKMVLDGCFIIELFNKVDKNTIDMDPLYTAKWVLPCIFHDILLLENQLPFIVLQTLFNHIFPPNKSPTLIELAHKFFDLFESEKKEHPPVEPVHLLHLYHSRLLPFPRERKAPINASETDRQKNKNAFCGPLLPIYNPSSKPLKTKVPPCATKLREAGIKFKKGKGGNFLDVKFENGVLILTPIVVDDGTNSLFRNLIAFEQCYPSAENHFTAYCNFMDYIINTIEDVEILEDKGIIENLLGSQKDVADLFNNMCTNVIFDIDNNYLSSLFQDITRYYRTVWNKWRAKLMHDYFNNPWAALSVAAAILLLFLTIAQTVFSVLPIVDPSSE